MHHFGWVFLTPSIPSGWYWRSLVIFFFFFLQGGAGRPSFTSFTSSSIALRPWLLVFLAHLGAVNKFMAQRGNYAQTFCIRPNGRGPWLIQRVAQGLLVPLRLPYSHSRWCNRAAVAGSAGVPVRGDPVSAGSHTWWHLSCWSSCCLMLRNLVLQLKEMIEESVICVWAAEERKQTRQQTSQMSSEAPQNLKRSVLCCVYWRFHIMQNSPYQHFHAATGFSCLLVNSVSWEKSILSFFLPLSRKSLLKTTRPLWCHKILVLSLSVSDFILFLSPPNI